MAAAGQAETWLRANTFWCESLLARLTPEQCQVNREKAGKRYEAESVSSRRYRNANPCAHCQGREPIKEKATRRCSHCKKRRPRSAYRKNQKTGNLVRACIDCERRYKMGPWRER